MNRVTFSLVGILWSFGSYADPLKTLLQPDRLCFLSFAKANSPLARFQQNVMHEMNFDLRYYPEGIVQWTRMLRAKRLKSFWKIARNSALDVQEDRDAPLFRTDESGIFALATLSLTTSNRDWKRQHTSWGLILQRTFLVLTQVEWRSHGSALALKLSYLFEAARLIQDDDLAYKVYEHFRLFYLMEHPQQVIKMAFELGRTDELLKVATYFSTMKMDQIFLSEKGENRTVYPYFNRIRNALLAYSYLKILGFKPNTIQKHLNKLLNDLADAKTYVEVLQKPIPLEFYTLILEVYLSQAEIVDLTYSQPHLRDGVEDSFDLAPFVDFKSQISPKIRDQIVDTVAFLVQQPSFPSKVDLVILNKALAAAELHEMRKSVAKLVLSRIQQVPARQYARTLFQSLDFLVNNKADDTKSLGIEILNVYISARFGIERNLSGKYKSSGIGLDHNAERIGYYAWVFQNHELLSFIEADLGFRLESNEIEVETNRQSKTSPLVHFTQQLMLSTQIRGGNRRDTFLATDVFPFHPALLPSQIRVLRFIEDMDLLLSAIQQGRERALPDSLLQVFSDDNDLVRLVDKMFEVHENRNAIFDEAAIAVEFSQHEPSTRDQALLTFLIALIQESKL